MKNPFRIEERPGEEAPREIYGWRPHLLALAASWASALYGYDSAFIGGTLSLPAFQSTFGLATASASEKATLSSNIVSTYQAGAFFGAIITFFAAERLGRKRTLLSSTGVFLVGAILQMIGRLDCLYAGRAICGLAIGMSTAVVPIYVSECAPAAIRGRLVGMFEVMLQVALVCGFWINYGVNKNFSPTSSTQWRLPVGIQFVPAGLLLLFMLPMVDSPRWLISRGKREEAVKALSWLRNLPADHPYLVRELAMIELAVEHELEGLTGSGRWKQIAKEASQKGIRNRILIAMLLMVLQNFTGINAINYYSPTIFKSIGYTGTSTGLMGTGIFGIVKMVATLLYAGFLVDKAGRRTLLLVGGVFAGIAMFYLAGYSKVSGSFEHIPKRDGGANAAVAMIYIYALFYGMSWNGIPWLFGSEVLPTRVRAGGMAAATCIQWLAQFVVVYSLPHMILGISYGTFLFYGAWTVVAIVFAFLFVPETKGVQLEDMDLLFGPDVTVFAIPAMRNYEEALRARAVAADEKGESREDDITYAEVV
ncbi:hypothetical protein SBRCBS47491_004477 [Sporothrix bragantina]|uniref:Quinate transporter n=1 Tax=Sporothrix bragantina TaxID=671064 RepID=A0ABP0BNR7_9PEZI